MSTSDVAGRLDLIQVDITRACGRAGRSPESVTVLGASKLQPISRMRQAHAAGLRVFGENRVQEAEAKQPLLPSDVEWHLIGPLQSNKVKKAVQLFSTVQSVDRPKIAHLLDREAARAGRKLTGFIEVNLGDEPTKHGFPASGLAAAVAPLAELEHLKICGLMAIPPFEETAEGSRRWFRRLRALRDELFSRNEWHGRAGYLSMGMSGDYAVAIEEGATHVRIGTALFGPREPS